MYISKVGPLVLPGTILFAISVLGQKVNVGYDKSVDFSKFRTYSWAETTASPARPMLYSFIVTMVDSELQSKGLTKTATNADLILVPAGGVGFELAGAAGSPYIATGAGPLPTIDSTMWTGAAGPSNVATWVSEGTLDLEFVEQSTNKVVWNGSVKQKLDTGDPRKSMERTANAVGKLLKQFPPKRK